jgi:hypothetical protein
MFSTCLFCHANLGRNDSIESFPIGRRLAFDAKRGRLWVICRVCDSWNLSPLEQRWAAVEECERSYRATPIRVSTDNIGLATLSSQVELVRVGKPLRPEFAAWRYGTRLRRRPLSRMAQTAASVTASAAVTGAAMAVGMTASLVDLAATVSGVSGMRSLIQQPLESLESRLHYDRVLAHIRTPDGTLRSLRFSHVARLEVIPGYDRSTWKFRIAHQEGITDLDGPTAGHIAGTLLSRLNRRGNSAGQVRQAARLITDTGDAERFIHHSGLLRHTRRRKNSIFWDDDVGVLGLTSTERLALEIAVHEDAERLAMQGELAALESAWRDAEEIAAISDTLFFDHHVPSPASHRFLQ